MILKTAPLMALALPLLMACAIQDQALPFVPDYQGVETWLLDGDLVQFEVAMTGVRGRKTSILMQNVPLPNIRSFAAKASRGICAKIRSKRVAYGAQMLFTPFRHPAARFAHHRCRSRGRRLR